MDTPVTIKQQLAPLWQANKRLVLFDGVCNFCNGSVNFIIRHDKQKRYLFVPLQEPLGKKLLTAYQLPEDYLDSLILLSNDRAYSHSTAALRIGEGLGGWWKGLRLLRMIPAFLRDAVYKIIARNRYRWFGKKESCMLPSADVRERFLLHPDDLKRFKHSASH
jgi:predicted DCC family thiol-disulfide oxidoreductase YuxK